MSSNNSPVSSDSSHSKRFSDKQLRQDVLRVAQKLGHAPSVPEYERHGTHSATTIQQRLGNGKWTDALEQLGFEEEAQTRRKIPEEELKRDLRRISNGLGYPPTVDEYNEHGQYSATTIMRRLGDGKWGDALDTIGFDLEQRMKDISNIDLKRDVKNVANKLGHPPTTTEYTEHGKYSYKTIARRFGDESWTDALDELKIS